MVGFGLKIPNPRKTDERKTWPISTILHIGSVGWRVGRLTSGLILRIYNFFIILFYLLVKKRNREHPSSFIMVTKYKSFSPSSSCQHPNHFPPSSDHRASTGTPSLVVISPRRIKPDLRGVTHATSRSETQHKIQCLTVENAT